MAKKEKLSLDELLEQALVKDEDKPYEIPSNWVWTKLGNVAEYKKGPFGSSITKSMFVEKGSNTYKIYEQGNAIRKDVRYGTYYITEGKYNELRSFSVLSNDILVSCAGTIGETYLLPENIEQGIINQALMRIRTNKRINLEFYILFFQEQLRTEITGKSKGTAIKNIPPFAILKQMAFPLPPLPEQQRIVGLIESLFEKLDRAKELVQNALDSFKNRKSAILHKAFTGELTAKWRKENNVTESAEALINRILEHKKNAKIKSNGEVIRTSNADVPKKWVVTNLGMIVKDFKYGVSEKSDVSYNGIPVIRIPNVISNRLDFTNLKYLNHKGVTEESLIQKDDLLIIRSNGSRDLVGKCALVGVLDRSYTFASYLIRIRPIIINANYLLYLLNSSYIRNQFFNKAKSSAGINNINSQELNSVFIPLPPLIEQDEIVHILDNLLENEQKAKELCDVIENIDHIKKTILARAFRGELSSNNPNEESATELLKEVLMEKN